MFNNHGSFDSVVIDSIGTYGVDDVSFDASTQVVPEPAPAIPVAVGLIGVWYAMRRFRGLGRHKDAASTRRGRA